MPHTHKLAKDDVIFRLYPSLRKGTSDWNELRTKFSEKEQNGISVSALNNNEVPRPYERLGTNENCFVFVDGRKPGDDPQAFNPQMPTVGAEKELASLTPVILNASHKADKKYAERNYYDAKLFKFFLFSRKAGVVRRCLLLWGEVEDTGDAGQFRVEFASAILNTSNDAGIMLLRQIYQVMGDKLDFNGWQKLEDFSTELTTRLNADPTIKFEMARFAWPPPAQGNNNSNNNDEGQSQNKLIVAANRMYCGEGLLKMRLNGKTLTTKNQVKAPEGVQLNYSVPLCNLGHVPAAWTTKRAELAKSLAKATTREELKLTLCKVDDGDAWKHSFLRVALESTNIQIQPGGFWLARAQLAAYNLITERVKAYCAATHTQRSQLNVLKLRSVFTIYLVQLTYETTRNSGADTHKDSLGHLVKTPVFDLVRQCLSREEQRFVLWFAFRDDFHAALNRAIKVVSLGATATGAIKFFLDQKELPEDAKVPGWTLDDKPTRPAYAEQLHDVTFKPGMVGAFYLNEVCGPTGQYSNTRKADAPDKKLRDACMVATSNICQPWPSGVNNDWQVLVETRSPKYTISQLMVPTKSKTDALNILRAVQAPLW